MISEAFATVLKEGRSDFNMRFFEARRRFPTLNGDEFAAFLTTSIDPVVAAVSTINPERTFEAASMAYDVALELVGQGLAGQGARRNSIEEGWRRIFPSASGFVAEEPARIIPAVCNAIHNLAATQGANPGKWLGDMERMATVCRDPGEFLKCGQVAAWRAGLAHFREGAIELAKALPEAAARAALGVRPGVSVSGLLDRLSRDPWFNPENGGDPDHAPGPRLRIARRAGAFRGFGGLFWEPPLVAASGEHFLVKSGRECWLLVADVFGAVFHRKDPGEFKKEGNAAIPSSITVEGAIICCEGLSVELPEIGGFTSIAANSHTLALTSPLTHVVTLLALT
ncbi:MAG: hypothetical protein ACP5SH_18220 [Syntrophobacteraceae bacterium]